MRTMPCGYGSRLFGRDDGNCSQYPAAQCPAARQRSNRLSTADIASVVT